MPTFKREDIVMNKKTGKIYHVLLDSYEEEVTRRKLPFDRETVKVEYVVIADHFWRSLGDVNSYGKKVLAEDYKLTNLMREK